MRSAVNRLELDLAGRTVVTEAATGAYVVTPVVAALAGARVNAVARPSRYGSAGEVAATTRRVADVAGVDGRIALVADKRAALLASADIVTNSGHLRPLDRPTIERMRPGAVISLMYEAWELRPGEVDLEACRERGVRVGATNERHPAVDVFSFLGPMAARLLTDAGVAVYSSRVLLLCDNPFRPAIEQGLAAMGAEVEAGEALEPQHLEPGFDAVLVALRPGARPVLSEADARAIGEHLPGAIVAQLWGDLPRDALRAARVGVWPPEAPAPGHMGILPSALGPEPIVRLQAAGLKVGELLCREAGSLRHDELDYVQLM
jgi:hypothetical protein